MSPNYLPIVAIAISIAGFLFQYLVIISKMQERIARLETKTELFWKGVEHHVIDMLKSYPSNINKDILLDKMARDELTLDDSERLRLILSEELRINPKRKNSVFYILVLGRLEQVIFDKLQKIEKGKR